MEQLRVFPHIQKLVDEHQDEINQLILSLNTPPTEEQKEIVSVFTVWPYMLEQDANFMKIVVEKGEPSGNIRFVAGRAYRCKELIQQFLQVFQISEDSAKSDFEKLAHAKLAAIQSAYDELLKYMKQYINIGTQGGWIRTIERVFPNSEVDPE
jgi:hypothetical protein